MIKKVLCTAVVMMVTMVVAGHASAQYLIPVTGTGSGATQNDAYYEAQDDVLDKVLAIEAHMGKPVIQVYAGNESYSGGPPNPWVCTQPAMVEVDDFATWWHFFGRFIIM